MIADVSTIVARGMGIRRGGRWILRPAVFGVTEGVIGLAGPPGAGKTTLLATFATMRRPQVGSIEVLGHDTGNPAGLRAARAHLGYLPADFSWAAGLRVDEFVGYAAYYKRMPADAVTAALERFELGEVAGMELGTLPADVRLRAGFAATCVHRPRLVLLDEPLRLIAGSGDIVDKGDKAVDKVAELWPLIRALAPTVLVTAPAVDHLTGRCDRVLTLARGRLTEPVSAPRRHPRAGARRSPVSTRRRRGVPALTPPSRPQRIGAGV